MKKTGANTATATRHAGIRSTSFATIGTRMCTYPIIGTIAEIVMTVTIATIVATAIAMIVMPAMAAVMTTAMGTAEDAATTEAVVSWHPV